MKTGKVRTLPLLATTASNDVCFSNNNQILTVINKTIADGPASTEEFDHDNDPSICGLPFLTVEEWESGRYWEGDKPVIVKNVTAGWAAMEHWKK